jgi:hypothetical protein
MPPICSPPILCLDFFWKLLTTWRCSEQQAIPCRYFSMGKCKFGSECLYLHERGGQVFNSAFDAAETIGSSASKGTNPLITKLDIDVVASYFPQPETPNPSPQGHPPDYSEFRDATKSLASSSSSVSSAASGLASIPKGQAVPSFKALETLRMIEVRKVGKKIKEARISDVDAQNIPDPEPKPPRRTWTG